MFAKNLLEIATVLSPVLLMFVTGSNIVHSGLSTSVSSGAAARALIPQNCLDIQKQGHNRSGVYIVYPYRDFPEYSLEVYCDMETSGGGWTVIQRRDDIQPREDFYRTWREYGLGFGDLNGEFWLGLNYTHTFTSQAPTKARFDLGDFEGNFRYAEYNLFHVQNASHDYKMSIYEYSGNAGDPVTINNNQYFSTKDRDLDSYKGDCATLYHGAWWYTACYLCNINGLYFPSGTSSNGSGIQWQPWKGTSYSLKFTEMKIRPNLD